MNIRCENCGRNHELDPPSWVVSSGRAFRFRCSACGNSQSVHPLPPEVPTEVPAQRAVTPAVPVDRGVPSVAPPALLDEDDGRPVNTALDAGGAAHEVRSARPAYDRYAGQGSDLADARPDRDHLYGLAEEVERDRDLAGDDVALGLDDDDAGLPDDREDLADADADADADPDADPDPDPDDGVDRRVVRAENTASLPPAEAAPAMAVPAASVAAASAEARPSDPPLFLKQNGQVYSVHDWDTLRRWIGERRIDRTDLVSEGGVRWEPIGSRPELAVWFTDASTPAAASTAPIPPPPGFPFDGDTPFGAASAEVWTDDDTEGVPIGLPPLPTDDGTGAISFVGRGPRAPIAEEDLYDGGIGPAIADLDPSVHYEPTGEFALPGTTSDADAELAAGDDDSDGEPPEDTDDQDAAPRPARGAGALLPDDDTSSPPGFEREVSPRPSAGRGRRDPGAPRLRADVDAGVAALAGAGAGAAAHAHAQAEEDAEDAEDEATHAMDPRGRAVNRDNEETRQIERPARFRRPSLFEDETQRMSLPISDDETPPPLPLTPSSVSRSSAGPRGPLAPIGKVEPDLGPESSSEFPQFDAAWEQSAIGRRPLWLWLGAAVVTALASAAFVVWTFFPLPASHPAPLELPAPRPVAPVPALSAPKPAQPASAPADAPAPAPGRKGAPSAAPAPIPAPSPPVAPAADAPRPTAGDVAKLVQQGWDKIDAKPADAARLFRQALDLAPDDDGANYGYGYAMLRLDRKAEATVHLCRARSADNKDIRLDVQGIITTNHLTCP